MTYDADALPWMLKRDLATNRAPFMDGVKTVSISLPELLTPEANLPASNPEWLPPWGSKT